MTHQDYLARYGVKCKIPHYVGRSWRTTNDCTVRTGAHALGIPYYEMYYRLSVGAGMQENKGVYWSRYMPVYRKVAAQQGLRLVKLRDAWRSVKSRSLGNVRTMRPARVCDFVRDHPEGNFIVIIERHIFNVVDGVIFDNWRWNCDFKREIWKAYRVQPL